MRSCGQYEARVSTPFRGYLALQQRFKRRAPSWRKRFDPQCALQLIARMVWRIQQRVDLCDSHSLLRLSHLYDFVAGAHLAFVQDTEVEARPSAGCQQSRHPWLVHPNADAVTCNARLGNLEQRGADLITVADAHSIVRQSFDCEVLAELSINEVGSLELLLPIAIRFDLIDEDGTLLASMSSQVPLTVSV